MRRRAATLVTLCLLALGVASLALGQSIATGGDETRRLEVEVPALSLSGVPVAVTLRPRGDGWPDTARLVIEADGRRLLERSLVLRDDSGALIESITVNELRVPFAGTRRLDVRVLGHAHARPAVRVVPAWLSILPPLLAILLAIALREVVVALTVGVWIGATIVHGYDPLIGLLRTADTYAVGALADGDHASIVVFSLVLGGMIGVIARSGGALGMAEVVTKVAKNRLTGGLATWLMGVAIFFDDYSSSLLAGTTMRPITDRLSISREKLAFLVDSTSAPVSSFALVSSWVGVEVGYIADQYSALGIAGDPYLVFLQTIPYRFYPILMLWFGLVLILTKRDFGPMWHAERRAAVDGHLVRPGSTPASDFDGKELTPPDGAKSRWYNAVIPILVVVVTAMVGMYTTGQASLAEARATAMESRALAVLAVEAAGPAEQAAAEALLVGADQAVALTDESLTTVIGKANSLKALLWAALLGGLAAILLGVSQRILTLREAMESWVAGARSISLAVIILVLAWSLGAICAELHTAQFLIQAIGGWLPPSMLPAVIFLIAAAVSFATGTSWGTMGILFPLVIPLAHELAPADSTIVLSSVASILGGSVWGDHCSPISDTTIMSSMASSCDHVDHVKTQLPYALAVGGVSLLAGEVATGLGLYGAPVGLLVGAIALFLMVRFLGKPAAGIEPR